MRLLSISLLWLGAAFAVMFYPVSFSVDGFGLIVSPDGVRSVRARQAGIVQHFTAEGDRFEAGEIVSAVVIEKASTQNALLESAMRGEISKAEADYLERTSKVRLDLERDRAKRSATQARLDVGRSLALEARGNLSALRSHLQISRIDVDALNEERLSQLDRLEELLRLSAEKTAVPEQRLVTMLDNVQSDRLAIISSKEAQFASSRMVMDLAKEVSQLEYTNALDEAELSILSDRVAEQERLLQEQAELRATLIGEARARYAAKLEVPQVYVSGGAAVDMRLLQPSRSEVGRGDVLRTLAEVEPAQGVLLMYYGDVAAGTLTLESSAGRIDVALPLAKSDVLDRLRLQGVMGAELHEDSQKIGAFHVVTEFLEIDQSLLDGMRIVAAQARDTADVPVPVSHEFVRQDTVAATDAKGDSSRAIVGFLENRHAVALRKDQRVWVTVSDPSGGADVRASAHLLDRDFATVDTEELGIRLGNQSLAKKIISRGVLSQVSVAIDPEDLGAVGRLPGALVHLQFPLERRSLLDFILNRNVEI